MGEVYRATDTNLGRQVAIKVLPEAFATDADRLARFDREARTLAALNHDNIAHIYGLERASHSTGSGHTGHVALVMELVEGETLAERIARGALDLDEALAIARQIADALAAAHAQGIIHRDLKPANIKVSPDGHVKVLDFGLAKALEQGQGAGIGDRGSGGRGVRLQPDISLSPTITSPAITQAGLILGTAAYMSPEQARGKAVDKRTDIWAFGCVLYEMLTGKRIFDGEEVSDTLAAVLRGDPEWAALPSTVPPGVAAMLRRCLEKDPRRRLHDIADAEILTEEVARAHTSPRQNVQPAMTRWPVLIAAGVALLIAGGAVAALVMRQTREAAAPARIERFDLVMPRDAAFVRNPPGHNVAISTDGSQIVYHVQTAGAWQLALRRLDRLEQALLPGTEQAIFPVFSPDGTQLAFVSRRRLVRIPVSGGPSTRIMELSADPIGLSWDTDDELVFAERGNGLFRVSAAGGKPERIAAPDTAKGERDFAAPQVLPGGGAILFTIVPVDGTANQARVAVRTLATGVNTILVDGAGPGRYLPTGHLLYHKAGTMIAAPMNVETLSIGPSTPMQEEVVAKVTMLDGASVNFGFASDGSLIYVPGAVTEPQRLIWVNREGDHLKPITEQRLLGPRYPRLSPDGRRLAVTIGPGNEGQIWILDLSGASQPLKLTFKAHNTHPIWSPTGTHIVFQSTVLGPRNIFRLPGDGSRLEPERLTNNTNSQFPATWYGDDLIFREVGPTNTQLMLLPMAGTDRKPRPLFGTEFFEDEAAFSPNGKWIGYVTDQTGSPEVVVRPFPGPGSPTRVSPGGGHDPVWSRDGKELFYQNGGRLMSAGVIAWEPALRLMPPRQLFDGGFVPYFTGTPRTYDVAPDGRFVMIEPNDEARPASLVLIKNWAEELKRLVPAR
jgi:serine/threonine-protein kinase